MGNNDLTPKDILAIFKENGLFSVEETPIGECIKMPALDAFIFGDITGSAYIDNPVFPYTTKGLLKIYYNTMDYNRVSGVFEANKLCHTPRILSDERPFLFDSEYKYIIPISFNTESELQNKLDYIYNSVDKPTDYMVMRIEASKKGGGLESFMEYIACLVFRNNGFIVENQVPLSHSTGSPDFSAIKLDSISSDLGSIAQKGFYTLELSLLWLKKASTYHNNLNDEKLEKIANSIIVGEAKTSTTIMESQIKKYLHTGLFNSAYELHPNKVNPSDSSFGLIRFANDHSIKIKEANTLVDYSDDDQEEYKKWLKNYIKTYLFINLDEAEIETMMAAKGLEYGRDDISNFVNNLTYQEIIERI